MSKQARGNDDLERMLENWARWKFSPGVGRAGSPFPIYNLGPKPPRYGNTMPVINGEAIDMDSAINSLQDRYKRALAIQYLWGDDQESKAKRCGCCVRTFRDRLILAKELARAAYWRAHEKNPCQHLPVSV
ncbi:MAG: hypothetical protein M0T84_17035 [Betaproteobacteria bacterium]|nr:hypothetical protein [Betaproteobacteria bacterium]